MIVDNLDRYSVIPADSEMESVIRQTIIPEHIKQLQAMIDSGYIDPQVLKRGLDFECGRGAITIAALKVFPILNVIGVDISKTGYDLLTEEERERAEFVQEPIQNFVSRKQKPFDIVLAGYISVPDPFDYRSFADLVTPDGLVVELYSIRSLPDFNLTSMTNNGFDLLERKNVRGWSNTIWRKHNG